MKNRDIKKDEINKITEECQLREKAFFTIMRQSGLTPHTIKQLQIKHVEKILEPNTPIPCKINIPHEKYPTFIGEEAIKYLKQYLPTRPNQTLTPENLLFTTKNNPNKEINTKNVSRAFKLAAQKLEKEKKITYKIERRKPSELRLFSLIKFYRKNAKPYLTELKNNNTPKDDESLRKLYEEKAMRFLDIETPDIYELENRLKKLETIVFPKESYDPLLEFYNKLLVHVRYLEEHPEKKKQAESLVEIFQEIELDHLRKTMEKLREIIQNQKSGRFEKPR